MTSVVALSTGQFRDLDAAAVRAIEPPTHNEELKKILVTYTLQRIAAARMRAQPNLHIRVGTLRGSFVSSKEIPAHLKGIIRQIHPQDFPDYLGAVLAKALTPKGFLVKVEIEGVKGEFSSYPTNIPFLTITW